MNEKFYICNKTFFGNWLREMEYASIVNELTSKWEKYISEDQEDR